MDRMTRILHNYRKTFFFSSLLALFMLFFGGIARDDTSIARYHRFARQPVFDCIGELYHNNRFTQSCILINERYILTSAHAYYSDTGQYRFDSLYVPVPGKWIYGTVADQKLNKATDYHVRIGGKKYRLKAINVHERYRNAGEYRDEFGLHPGEGYSFDLALAELEEPVSGYSPPEIYSGKNELGKRAIMAGYGSIEKASDYNRKSMHIRRKTGGENWIDSVGGFRSDGEWAALFMDFDHHGSSCCNRMGDPIALPLEYMVNTGDCGSGLFIEDGGEWKLAGLCASTDYPSDHFLFGQVYEKYYGFTFDYIRLSVFREWIKANIKG